MSLRIKKHRVPLKPYIIPTTVIIAISLGSYDQKSFVIGALFSLVGVLFRLWTKTLKQRSWSLEGPYRFLRHPKTLGSGLMVLGIGIAANNLFSLLLPLGAMIYLFKKEVAELEKRQLDNFGPVYSRYRAYVPALVPRIWPVNNAVELQELNKGFGTNWRRMLKLNSRDLLIVLSAAACFVLLNYTKHVENTDYYRYWLTLIAGIYLSARFVYDTRLRKGKYQQIY